MNRLDKKNYYLDIAETVLERGTCLRRNFGAIIVNHDEIISTGYVGAPRGRKNCIDLGVCVREQLGMGKFGRIVENHDEALAGGMEDFLSGRESCEDWRERAARGGDEVAYESAVRKVEHLLEEMK